MLQSQTDIICLFINTTYASSVTQIETDQTLHRQLWNLQLSYQATVSTAVLPGLPSSIHLLLAGCHFTLQLRASIAVADASPTPTAKLLLLRFIAIATQVTI